MPRESKKSLNTRIAHLEAITTRRSQQLKEAEFHLERALERLADIGEITKEMELVRGHSPVFATRIQAVIGGDNLVLG